MNKLLVATAALSLIGANAALAQDNDRGGRWGDRGSSASGDQGAKQAPAPAPRSDGGGWRGGREDRSGARVATPAGEGVAAPAHTGQGGRWNGGQAAANPGAAPAAVQGDSGRRWNGGQGGSNAAQSAQNGSRWQGNGQGRGNGGDRSQWNGSNRSQASNGQWSGSNRGQWNGDRSQWNGSNRGQANNSQWNGSNRSQWSGSHNYSNNNNWNGANRYANRDGWNGRSWNGQNYRRNWSAQRRYNIGSYYRPDGWYYRRWSYGQILPSIFFSQNYWLNDYGYYGLPYPPPGCQWVRYGDDAMLVDIYSGEIIQVVYGIFY